MLPKSASPGSPGLPSQWRSMHCCQTRIREQRRSSFAPLCREGGASLDPVARQLEDNAVTGASSCKDTARSEGLPDAYRQYARIGGAADAEMRRFD